MKHFYEGLIIECGRDDKNQDGVWINIADHDLFFQMSVTHVKEFAAFLYKKVQITIDTGE